MRTARCPMLVFTAALVAAATAGCGSSSSGGSGGGATDAITLYNGQHEQTTQKLVAGFTAATGIKVNVRSDDEDVFDNQIQTEGSHSPADVIYTENTPALQYLQERHLLAPVDQATLQRIPAKYSSSQGDWAGISARVSVLDYNPSLISRAELPKTALAMADPKYRGKLAIAPGETDFQPIVTSMVHNYGAAATSRWLDGIKANAGESHTYPDNETVVADINSGKVAFGLINQYYWYRLGGQIGSSNYHSQLAYFAPRDPGYVINVSGIGILASSQHQTAAQKFVAYLTSKPGQTILANSDSYEYPLLAGVKPGTTETPLSQLKPAPINIDELGDGRAALALLKQAQLL
jgi:iron(III) transport system substrate-binding protein